jgi:hypothetical protein
MATFLSSLWDSVFTPGTTPTLLLATNGTFALLQTLLFALLIATYSLHFVVLSVLCAGLWVGINWFAKEVQLAREEQTEKEKKERAGGTSKGAGNTDGGEADDEGEDEGQETETEVEVRKSAFGGNGGEDAKGQMSAATGVEKQANAGIEIARQRRLEDGSSERSGDVSTDSEWERISQEGDR